MVPWWSVGPSALADPCMTWRFWDEMGLAHGAMVPTWAGLVCVAQKGAQAVRLSGSVRPRPSERPREPSLMGPGGRAAGPSLAFGAGPGRSHWVTCHSAAGLALGFAANLCLKAGLARAQPVLD